MELIPEIKKKLTGNKKEISVIAITASVIVVGLLLMKLIADKQDRIDY